MKNLKQCLAFRKRTGKYYDTTRQSENGSHEKENENFKFRIFLKCHADEDELDRQFLRLHKELFADCDCSKCRNCCKMYKGSIPKEDIDMDAQCLGITPEQFVDV